MAVFEQLEQISVFEGGVGLPRWLGIALPFHREQVFVFVSHSTRLVQWKGNGFIIIRFRLESYAEDGIHWVRPVVEFSYALQSFH